MLVDREIGEYTDIFQNILTYIDTDRYRARTEGNSNTVGPELGTIDS